MKRKKPATFRKPDTSNTPSDLRQRAKMLVLGQRKHQPSKAGVQKSNADDQRLLQELQIHQIELELQNAELQVARDQVEIALEKYTDLYDFAPVGYLSVDASGMIGEANLTGAALFGVERPRLIHRPFVRLVVPASRAVFLSFLESVCAGSGKQVCEVALLKDDGTVFWASLHGTPSFSPRRSGRWCRVTISDITSLKKAKEAEIRLETLAVANHELRREIVRREAVEQALKKSEQEQRRLLEKSRQMQQQLRHISHQILRAQEEERKRISRELHDEIAQTLTGITVRLAALKSEDTVNTNALQSKITSTQRLVEKSVKIVHRFARELRPSVLDDLGLIPALHSFVKLFAKRTRLPVRLRIFAGVEQLDSAKRTVLYRVAQESLTNIARHARASKVEMGIEKSSNSVHMTVKDNGKAFSVERTLHGQKQNRLGLLGMRERVEMVGGRFTIVSTPGDGTTIKVQIPFRGRGRADSFEGS